MNKYQKQAIVDLAKVAGVGLAVILAIGAIIRLGMETSDLVGALGVVAMGYCVYQLYLVRVGQLESEDRLNNMERKYK